MAYNFPIYKRGETFVIHVRIFGKQIKRSLRTGDPALAMARASRFMAEFQRMKDKSLAHGWEIDLATGKISAEPGQDSEDLRKSVPVLQEAGLLGRMADFQTLLKDAFVNAVPPAAPTAPAEPASSKELSAALKDFIEVSAIGATTKGDYASYAKQLNEFWAGKQLHEISVEEVARLIKHLRTIVKNGPRTVDNKVGFLRAAFNHAIKMGEYKGSNPASEKNLVSKKQKKNSGAKSYRYNDLATVFGGKEFLEFKTQRPELYLVVMTGLVTGMRVSSVCRLKLKDLKVCVKGTPYIDIKWDKSAAGSRDVPVPWPLYNALSDYLQKNDGFGLKASGEKGYSDAVRKPIMAFRKDHGFVQSYPKLSFHSFRKSCNNYLLQQKVPVYMCAALVGHEDNSMTTGVYGDMPAVDEIASHVGHHQTTLLQVLNFQWP
jgi:integrase